jgi:hypothetical protein
MTISKYILIGAVIILFIGGCTKHKLLDPYSKACKIRYQAELFADNWKSPQETAKSGMGDCEDQAFYLWHMFKEEGLKSRVVFGFLDMRKSQGDLHAWVEIPMGTDAIILDPSSGIMVPKSMMFIHYVEVHGIPGLSEKVTEFKKRTGLSGFNKFYENPSKLTIPMLILPQSKSYTPHQRKPSQTSK